uniref:G-protein coupled receptors family 1 profile domain-containing protein n=1 Tax=Leptobrachium leishanense TaxID=445787 RepID=A0A8C5M733_9ANUR
MDYDNINMTVTEYDDGGYSPYAAIHFTIASAFAIALCLFGTVGNVIVFWFLSFKVKKNKYTVYIINLAVADFIFLIFTALNMMIYINSLVGTDKDFTGVHKFMLFIEIFYDSSQYAGMFFLSAISVERCLSVIFPMWYHCHRPKKLSPTVCILLWITACTESLIENLACTAEDFQAQSAACTGIQLMTFIIGIGICLPLMVISSLVLLVAIKRTFQNHYPPKLYIIIIIAVIIFILSVVPFNFLWFLMYFQLLGLDVNHVSLFYATVFSTALNGTVDPYIYFLVGRQWKQRSHHSIQDVLERAFKDNEELQNNGNPDSDQTNSSTCPTHSSDEEKVVPS